MRLSVLVGVVLLVGCPGEPPASSVDSGAGSGDGSVADNKDGSVTGDAAVPPDATIPLIKVCTVPKPVQGPTPSECGALPAGTCTSGADCASGLCLQLASGKRCTTGCKTDTDCAAEERCRMIERLGEGYCVPKTGVTP